MPLYVVKPHIAIEAATEQEAWREALDWLKRANELMAEHHDEGLTILGKRKTASAQRLIAQMQREREETSA